MYPNLRAEMARKNISVLALAKICKIPNSTLTSKIKGKTKMTLDDAKKIKSALHVDMPLEDLFAKEAM